MAIVARGHSTGFIRQMEEADIHPDVRTLARLCIRKDIPIRRVAELLGVTRKTVYNWMVGTNSPRAAQIQAIVDVTEQLRNGA